MNNKINMLVAATALVLSSGAAIASQSTEVGYKAGSLGVSAIVAGDYETAARQLTAADGARVTDPARLINLGNAYAGMGRYGDARAAYVAAYQAPAIDMMLADGSVKSSRMIAHEGLRRLRANYAAR